MTVFSVLPIIPILIVLLWPLIPVRQKPGWLVFLPAAAFALTILDMLIDGFQPALLGLYIFSLVLFLRHLPGLIRQVRQPAAASPQPAHRARAILGGLLGAALLAMTLVPAVLFPFHYDPPMPGGQYAVGTVTYGWEDAARLETYTPDPADHRKIAVQFWYPADTGQAGAKTAVAVENAPLSAQKAQYPLVVFSHGAFGIRASNTTTYMELASQGYIVASIDHAYHAFYTRFPDGTSAMISQQFLNDLEQNQSGAMSAADSTRTTNEWMDLRTGDIRFTLDQIQALNSGKEKSPFSGHIDETKIGLFGHSLGGAASASVCRSDSRCKAVAVIDATMFGEYQPGTTDGTLTKDPYPQPLMIFYNGDMFNATPEHLGYVPDIQAFNHAAGPAYSVMVFGAQHLNFTDLPARAPVLARLLGNMMTVNGGTTGSISQDRCMEILDSYLLDFFNQALLGEPAPLLSGQTPYQEVEFSTHQAQ